LKPNLRLLTTKTSAEIKKKKILGNPIQLRSLASKLLKKINLETQLKIKKFNTKP